MFAAGLARSVTQSVEMAAGVRREFGQSRPASSALDRARHWFMDSFPLLGSMVAAFDIIEDASICEREDIAVAAVDEVLRTIYINPGPRLSELELRFVIAHEVLHVALRHLPRRRGREPFLWNVACDFVINDWLIQMDVGQPPGIGLLYDPELRGLAPKRSTTASRAICAACASCAPWPVARATCWSAMWAASATRATTPISTSSAAPSWAKACCATSKAHAACCPQD
jgi:hypothetical protein